VAALIIVIAVMTALNRSAQQDPRINSHIILMQYSGGMQTIPG